MGSKGLLIALILLGWWETACNHMGFGNPGEHSCESPYLPSDYVAEGSFHIPRPSKLHKSMDLIRLLSLRQGRSLHATHATTGTHATTKRGEDNAQISPKSELCGFKWANNHKNKCVHDSMQLADLSPKPCLKRLHNITH